MRSLSCGAGVRVASVSATPRFDEAWATLDDQVASGRFPGYAAAIRHGDHTEIRTGGFTSLDAHTRMRPDTVFRIASLSKIVGGVLALRLARGGAFTLDSEVAPWLPELAFPRVLRSPGAELDDTVPAERPIVVRDLLTFTFGLGFLLEDCPLSRAMVGLGLTPGRDEARIGPDELMARVATLPLAYQPGVRWLYHTGADLVGVLASRALGRPLGELLAEYVTEPLGMDSTAFHASDASRVAASYRPGPSGLELDDPGNRAVTQSPAFESLGGGLVSTVEDYLGFLNAFSSTSVLDAQTTRLMTSDSLTDAQRLGIEQLMGPGVSWGLCVGLDLERRQPWMRPGRFWWNGGSGTTACVDPANDLAAVLMTQRMMTSATGAFDDFWRAVYTRLN
jgi:CubicO group peptidase (beta-lactamase class C family)